MHNRRLITATVGTALALLFVAACSGLPSTGDIKTDRQGAQQSIRVQIHSQVPQRTWDAQTFVSNFFQALTGDDKDPTFSTAQKYVSPALLAKTPWSKLIASPATVTLETPSPTRSSPPDAEVQTFRMAGTQIGTLNTDGYFQPRSGTIDYAIGIAKDTSNIWQITSLPPNFGVRLIGVTDFVRANPNPFPVYVPVKGRGSAGYYLDQTYLTGSPNPADMIAALTRAVLAGPPADRSDLLTGIQASKAVLSANNPVTAEPATGRLTVNIDGTLTGPEINALNISFDLAQDVMTASGVTPPPGIGVVLHPSGLKVPLNIHKLPDSSPGTAALAVYRIAVDQQRVTLSEDVPQIDGAGAAVPPSSAAPTPIPVDNWFGKSGSGLSRVAVDQAAVVDGVGPAAKNSRVPRIAAVGSDGRTVYVGDSESHAVPPKWYVGQRNGSITDLRWDPIDGSLWIVDGGIVHDVTDGSGGRVVVTTRAFPATAVGLSTAVQGIRFAPDGLRALLITGTPASTTASTTASTATADTPPSAWVSWVDRSGVAGDAGFTLTPSFALQPTPDVIDADWAGPRVVALLAKPTTDPNATGKIYKVFADGSPDGGLDPVQEAASGATSIAAAGPQYGTQPGTVRIYTDGYTVGPEKAVLPTVFRYTPSGVEPFGSGALPVLAVTHPGPPSG